MCHTRQKAKKLIIDMNRGVGHYRMMILDEAPYTGQRFQIVQYQRIPCVERIQFKA